MSYCAVISGLSCNIPVQISNDLCYSPSMLAAALEVRTTCMGERGAELAGFIREVLELGHYFQNCMRSCVQSD